MAALSASEQRRTPRQTMAAVWVLLIGAGLLCCVLLFGSSYGVWAYYTNATDARDSTLIVRTSAESVTWQRRERTTFERAPDQQTLREGDRVRIAGTAGYGQAATVRMFDGSTMDLWANADVLLDAVQTSRWNTLQQHATIRQYNGYVRYDVSLAQTYQQAAFHVLAGTTSVDLRPGGSYSIDVIPSTRRVLTTQVVEPPHTIDIAVRSGEAWVQTAQHRVRLFAGQRVAIADNGLVGVPQLAVWSLLRDGSFTQYSDVEYNNTTITNQPTLPRAQTWQVFSGSAIDGVSASGYFALTRACPPPSTTCASEQQRQVAAFTRRGDQTRGFVTGVRQMLGETRSGVDISEYRSLVFSMWANVRYQSLALAGERGTECPLMVRFLFKQQQPTDAEQERVACLYTSQDPAEQPERAPGITYYRLPQDSWGLMRIELRDADWLPNARYLRSVEVYANGHDYDAVVTSISLVGSHYQAENVPPTSYDATVQRN